MKEVILNPEWEFTPLNDNEFALFLVDCMANGMLMDIIILHSDELQNIFKAGWL